MVSEMTHLISEADGLQISPPKRTLLTIPGEIRNKIYAYCTEDRVLVLLLRYEGQHYAGDFRSLTQVCRQLRDEFRPLYQRLTTIRPYFPDLQKRYIEAFYPWASPDVMVKCQGNLVIPLYHSVVDPEDLNMNIAPVLRHTAFLPQVRFRFEYDNIMPASLEPAVNQLNNFLACIQHEANPKRRDLVKALVHQVELEVDRWYSRINFMLKNDIELGKHKKEF
ncbi:hypothetical protein EK21DRAFT_117696 [Setomelanomma holmii]|uniref:F-box domain-containing protein n=1 Tax=Setomelanomma holmii TaxID=210430 RepID=A0A9P4GZT5_9PLEO|nr:hypothetical protein EK21DRAFT_117696 [Setomelanomma holmii]